MFERFTAQARSAVIVAQQEARELGHPGVGTEHLLLAILVPDSGGARVLRSLGLEAGELREQLRRSYEEGRSFTGAEADALRSVGIDLDEVRRRLDEAFGPGALERPIAERRVRGRMTGHLPFAREAKKALELALREALQLGHRHIGTEHVVLGLVRDERSAAARILRARALDRERVREAVLRELAHGDERPGRTA